MSPGNYSIELYFDAQLENQVLKAWNVLARRKISTQLIDMESRPHITLCSCSSLPWDPARLEPLLKNFASKQEPLPLFLSCIGGTPNEENVLFLAPTPSVSLLQFQSQLCDLFRKEGIEVGDEFRPEKWVPYVSVAQEVPRSQLGEAFCVLKDLKLPVDGYGIEIGCFCSLREFLGCCYDGKYSSLRAYYASEFLEFSIFSRSWIEAKNENPVIPMHIEFVSGL